MKNKISSWAFKEAERILESLSAKTPKKGYVLFETGYGPSGFPHIGTFAEVVRTNMVIKAFEEISNIPVKLFCVSDDMDGLRKIPDNIPNKNYYYRYIDMPVSQIPSPFDDTVSYAYYMNSKLIEFLDKFEFYYDFISSANYYKSGRYNYYLTKILSKYDEIMDVMLPTLGKERRETYSLFLPICKNTGKVLKAKVIAKNLEKSEITYLDESGMEVVTSVLNGCCKLQWKPDFAMRWAALDVDYEIYGKDISANADVYSKICRILGKEPPVQMPYELFLDENGEKISKSKGNGISTEDWLKYGDENTLKFFMYQSPKKAKKLSYSIIPKIYDEYLNFLQRYYIDKEKGEHLSNPVFYIFGKDIPNIKLANITFSLLLNLLNACNTTKKAVIFGCINDTMSVFDDESKAYLDKLLDYAIAYYKDFILSKKQYKTPNDIEKILLKNLYDSLKFVDNDIDSIQNVVYKTIKEFDMPMNQCFKSIYQILLGTEYGPRMGTLFYFYGLNSTRDLISSKIPELIKQT